MFNYNEVLKLPINEMIEFSTEEEIVADEAIREVQEYLYTQYKIEKQIYPHFLGRKWVQEDNSYGYNGTFPKRLKKWVRNYHEIVLTDEDVSMIGNIARKSVLKHTNYRYKVTDDFDWRPGEFGDSLSCFWRENQNAKKILKQRSLFRAFKFYNEEGRGVARILCHPATHKKELLPVLFNIYTAPRQGDLEFIPALSKFFKVDYSSVPLRNCGLSGEILYINRGLGYLLHDREVVPEEQYDFQLPIDPFRVHKCVVCDAEVMWGNLSFNDDGGVLCAYCS